MACDRGLLQPHLVQVLAETQLAIVASCCQGSSQVAQHLTGIYTVLLYHCNIVATRLMLRSKSSGAASHTVLLLSLQACSNKTSLTLCQLHASKEAKLDDQVYENVEILCGLWQEFKLQLLTAVKHLEDPVLHGARRRELPVSDSLTGLFISAA